MSNKISVVVGGQFGSEGKGAIAAYLSSAERNPGRHVMAVRVAGPNAGHTVLGACPPDCPDVATHSPDTLGWVERATGQPAPADVRNAFGWSHPWKLRQVPVAAVTNPRAELVIAAGSEVDPVVLLDELSQLDAAGYNATARTIVDRSATVLETAHVQAERDLQLTDRLGSTGKGIGAARMARIARTATTWEQLYDVPGNPPPVASVDTVFYLNRMLARDDGGRTTHVIIEGTQGYGLGVHTQYYPQSTSSDCRAIDFLAMAGISPWVLAPRSDVQAVGPDEATTLSNEDPFEVWVVMRTYPIRVAGNSGHLNNERSWDELGLPAERTTVTNKIRRVGDWDPVLARRAVEANGGLGLQRGRNGGYQPPVRVALTMADYRVPGVAGHLNASYDQVSAADRSALFDLLSEVARDCTVFPTLVGTGPNSILDLRPPTESGLAPVAGLNPSVIRRIQEHVGQPYTWAGEGEAGFEPQMEG